MVILQIIGLSKMKGQMVPDAKKLVATIRLENEKIDVNVHNPKYQNRIKELFFNRHLHLFRGMPSKTTYCKEEKMKEKWESDFIQEFLPSKLSMMGLTLIVKEDEQQAG